LVRNIGVSNFEIVHLQSILEMPDLKYKPQVNQLEVQPYYQRNDILRFCQQRGIAITAHSCLGGPGNPWASQHKFKLLEDPIVTGIATELGKSNAQVILRWALQRGLSVIPKSVNEDRLGENHDIFNFELSQSQVEAMNALDRGDNGKVCHPSTPWLGQALFPDELEAMKETEKTNL
jgi:diketogulonate reductase-like aldo/keto reductase